MLSNVVQRWRDGRETYRPAGEPFFEVASMPDDTTPRVFVERHHYSGDYPAALHRFGLHRGAELVGVAVFSVPVNYATLAILPGSPKESAELGRLVLLDDVKSNGESWFISRCFEALRARGVVGVVSFSDPLPRMTADGRVRFKGHVGTIYQATNGVYLGPARKGWIRLLPDGNVLHARAIAKVRAREQGWRYAAAKLETFGAAPLGEREDAAAWADTWVARLTRRVFHPGNHKYAWTLRRRDRRHLPASLAYPKFDDGPLFRR